MSLSELANRLERRAQAILGGGPIRVSVAEATDLHEVAAALRECEVLLRGVLALECSYDTIHCARNTDIGDRIRKLLGEATSTDQPTSSTSELKGTPSKPPTA